MTRRAFLVVKICIKCEHGNSFNTGEWKVKGKTVSRQKVQWHWFSGVCWLHRQPGTDFQADEARALLLLLPLPEKIDLHWCISLFKSIGLLGNGVLHFHVLLLAFQSWVKPIYLDCQSLQLLKSRLGQLCTVWHLPIFCERPPQAGEGVCSQEWSQNAACWAPALCQHRAEVTRLVLKASSENVPKVQHIPTRCFIVLRNATEHRSPPVTMDRLVLQQPSE